MRNVEVKARLRDPDSAVLTARALSAEEPEDLKQRDTFFSVTRGRLKLREENGRAFLVFYERPDRAGPSESEYALVDVMAPERLKTILVEALGLEGAVSKSRKVFIVGEVRVHIDEVEGLGDFLEIEVPVGPGLDREDAGRKARELLDEFRIDREDLLKGSYCDMLNGENDP